jgi:uncharacterized protein (TIGR01777 family)
MRILVSGGSGFLGSALGDSLKRDGHQVTNLTRTPRHHQDLAWTPQAGPSAIPVINDTDVIVNLAGESIAGRRWTAARKEAIRGSRVAATRALAEAIRSARRPPPVFISASGIDVYGPRGDEQVTEDTPHGSGFLASVCREWEAEALVAAGRTRVVLLRTALVLARHGGALPQMARPFWFFAGGPLGSGRQHVSWIHLDDWIAMVRWAIGTAAISGPLNVTSPQPVTNSEMAKTLGRVLHRPWFVPAPALALRLMLGTEMADTLLLNGRRAVPAKALANGFSFRYPDLESALRAIYQGAAP